MKNDLHQLEQLRKDSSDLVDELIRLWSDPYKAPEQKLGFGQQTINDFARLLSSYAQELGLASQDDQAVS